MGRVACRRLIVTCAASVFLFAATAGSEAQPLRRYQPSRPTVSPYLDLFRFNDGIVPNYYTYVRPKQQLREFEQRQQWQLQQQAHAIRQLQGNVQTLSQPSPVGPLVAPTGTGSWFNQPSSRSKYLNTSRYYSQSGTGPER